MVGLSGRRVVESLVSQHPGTIHFAERVTDEFETFAIWAEEVERRTVHVGHLNPCGFESFAGSIPFVRCHRNCEMVVATENLLIRPEIKTGHVKKGEAIAVTDVEKEMGAAGVVTIFEEFGQREAKKALIKVDGLFNV